MTGQAADARDDLPEHLVGIAQRGQRTHGDEWRTGGARAEPARGALVSLCCRGAEACGPDEVADGREYEIDLSEKNAKALRKDLEPWAAAARRVSGRRAARGPASRVETARPVTP
jgi:hypothetical protein